MSTIQDITHADMVSKLAKSGDEILKTLTPEKCHCFHMILGISGEAGELLDQIKKHVIYGKKLDRENIIEELGDLEFYIQGLRDGLKIRRNDTIKANIDKLSIRYQGFNYTDEAAIARADKKDQQVNNEELAASEPSIVEPEMVGNLLLKMHTLSYNDRLSLMQQMLDKWCLDCGELNSEPIHGNCVSHG